MSVHAPLSPLEDDAFVREAFARGWFPKQAMENAELRAIVLPTLRADMAVYDSYRAECATAESKSSIIDDIVVIEAFAPRHATLHADQGSQPFRSGPADDRLASHQTLASEFDHLELLVARETEVGRRPPRARSQHLIIQAYHLA